MDSLPLQEFESLLLGHPKRSLVTTLTTLSQLSVIFSTSVCCVTAFELFIQRRKSVKFPDGQKGVSDAFWIYWKSEGKQEWRQIRFLPSMYNIFGEWDQPQSFSRFIVSVYPRLLKLFANCKVLYRSIGMEHQLQTSCNFVRCSSKRTKTSCRILTILKKFSILVPCILLSMKFIQQKMHTLLKVTKF